MISSLLLAFTLAGEWNVNGNGIAGKVMLPGSLADANLGEVQNYQTWAAEPDHKKRHVLWPRTQFMGEATYSRRFTMPRELVNCDCELELERVMWKSSVKIDGKRLGELDSLGTPHVYSIPANSLSAGEHTIEISVDNSPRYGFAGHSHGWGWHTQTVWHGVIGKLELREKNPLEAVRIFAPYPTETVEVETDVKGEISFILEGSALKEVSRRPSPYAKGKTLIAFALDSEIKAWSDNHPTLYRAQVIAGNYAIDRRIGFRTIKRKGNRLFLNDKPLWIRADVDNCQFPDTGYPAMGKAEWRRQIRIQQEQGLNAMRFHTWTPPKAAFEASDELGFLLFVETGFWATPTHNVGVDAPELSAFVHSEVNAMVREYGESPSFIGVEVGNELGRCDFEMMNNWMEEVKAKDPRHLTMASTARKVCPSDDMMVTHLYPGIGPVRCRFRDNTDWDFEDVYSKTPIPVVSHEIGQWPVYPLWNDIGKYDQLLRAFSWQWMRDRAVENNTLRFNRLYHTASLKASRFMYKDETESYLRTKSCAGMQLLDVRDYTGQGDALVGWLDAFFDPKPALSEVPAYSTVMRELPFLARIQKFIWSVGETFTAKLEMRNLTEAEIPVGAKFAWSFADKTGWVTLDKPLEPGELREVGQVAVKLDSTMTARHQELRFGENRWNIFVLGGSNEVVPVPEGVTLTDNCRVAADALAKGGKVIYTGPSRYSAHGSFRPFYWSNMHFTDLDPFATIGTWFDEDHPAFADFPTEGWADWLWRHLADKAIIHRLDKMGDKFRPIAMPVPDIHTSVLLGSMFELKVGDGSLYVCGYPLDVDLPEARQLRRSIFAYVGSKDFQPTIEKSLKWFESEFAATQLTNDLSEKDYKVERLDNGKLRVTVKARENFAGTVVIWFSEDGSVEGTVEGRKCEVITAMPTVLATTKVTPEDSADGKYVFEFRAIAGTIPDVALITLR